MDPNTEQSLQTVDTYPPREQTVESFSPSEHDATVSQYEQSLHLHYAVAIDNGVVKLPELIPYDTSGASLTSQSSSIPVIQYDTSSASLTSQSSSIPVMLDPNISIDLQSHLAHYQNLPLPPYRPLSEKEGSASEQLPPYRSFVEGDGSERESTNVYSEASNVDDFPTSSGSEDATLSQALSAVYTAPFFTENQNQASSKLYAIAKMVTDSQISANAAFTKDSSHVNKVNQSDDGTELSNDASYFSQSDISQSGYHIYSQTETSQTKSNSDSIEVISNENSFTVSPNHIQKCLNDQPNYTAMNLIKSIGSHHQKQLEETAIDYRKATGKGPNMLEHETDKESTNRKEIDDTDKASSGNHSDMAHTEVVAEIREERKENRKLVHVCDLSIDKLENNPEFICGSCSSVFTTICHLHLHLKKHDSAGSYHFDSASQTAYPKYDTFCSFTQTTDDFICETQNKPNQRMPSVEKKVLTSQAAIVTRQSLRKQEELETESEDCNAVLSPASEIKGRQRKQTNPKPCKPIEYIIPVENQPKNKKVKDAKTKKVIKNKRGRKAAKKINKVDDAITTSDSDFMEIEIDPMENEVEGDTNKSEKSVELNSIKSLSQPETAVNENEANPKLFKKRGKPRSSTNNGRKSASSKPSNSTNTLKRLRKNNVEEPAVEANKSENNIDTENNEKITTDVNLKETEDADSATAETENECSEMEDKVAKRQKIDVGETEGELTETEELTKRQKKEKEKSSPKNKYQMCGTCGLYVPRHTFLYHTRSHTGEKPFTCEKCGKSFARSRFLIKHMVTHAEVKPWRCHYCPSQFCQKNEYNMHILGHEGDRPHKCNVCEIKFLSKTSLHTHQANIHMGLTKFECEVCKRRFFKRSSLTVHQATHFEATMTCSFCERKFRDKTGLKRHERIHTGVKKFQCHICEHAFIQSTPFWAHMEKRHFMSRVKVKEMLKEIKEQNRRSGIKTELSVLPQSAQSADLHLQEIKPKTELKLPVYKVSEKYTHGAKESSLPLTSMKKVDQEQVSYSTDNDHHRDYKSHDLLPSPSQSQTSKSYTEQKLNDNQHHGVAASGPQSDMYTTLDSIHNEAAQQFPLPPSYLPQVPTTTTTENSNSDAGIDVTNSNVYPTGVFMSNHLQALQHAINMQVGSTAGHAGHHGFIGINTLQQALEHTSLVGSQSQNLSYTDISNSQS